MEEYAREFESYLMKCGVNEDEPQTLVRFLGGLDTRIARVVELHPYTNLEELVILAHKVEQQQKIKPKSESQRSFIRSVNYAKITAPNVDPSPQKTAPSNLPLPQRNTPASNYPISNQRPLRKCFRCQGAGHIASECPNKRVITMVEYESIEVQENENDEDK